MSEVRQRKAAASPAEKTPQKEEEDNSKTKSTPAQGPDLEPNPIVLAILFITFSVVVGSLLFYKVDNSQGGDFARWVNEKFPAVNSFLNSGNPGRTTNVFGAAAETTTDQISLTEEELKPYDGTDPDLPIYLAINGTIFDVSASPAFYGPGGHYHHFTGKDATRAWVTECWDTDDQFTWRMDDIEVMFMPKWMDETFEELAAGTLDPESEDDESMKMLPKDKLVLMAQKSIEKLGRVSEEEKVKRRAEDKLEAETKAHDALAHWIKFFSGNAKYKTVGTVIRDESRPTPPAPCAAAFKKRQTKYGKLQPILANAAAAQKGGAGAGAGAPPPPPPPAAGESKAGTTPPPGPPDFVKKMMEEKKKQEEAAAGSHDEL